MTDSLRTRIAAVLEGYVDHSHRYDLADMLIRELRLQPETLYLPGGAILTQLDNKVLADNRYMTRWATPWEADERPVK